MKLNRLTIDNYRCYQHTEFEFGKKTTVFIGKNGTGKSSVLKALKSTLDVFFIKNIWSFNDSFAGPVPGLKPTQIKSTDFWHNNRSETAESICLTTEADFQGVALPRWSVFQYSRNLSKLKTTMVKEAFIELLQRKNMSGTYPFFAYYSDRFPHIDHNNNPVSPSEQEVYNEKIDPRWGYWRWDKEPAASRVWRQRYGHTYRNWIDYQVRIIESGSVDELSASEQIRCVQMQRELDFVKNRIVSFTQRGNPELSFDDTDWSVSNIGVNGEDELTITLDNSEKIDWNELPAGYERLLNIVFDIAYRSLLLNGPEKEVQGVVIIDEVDLHLHPSLQRDVLQRFRLAFPEVQFIVTTHSPIVVSHFPVTEGNKIIKLEHVDGQYHHSDVPDWSYLDYLTTLQMIMDTDPNSNYLRDLKDRYIRFKRRGQEELANDVIKLIGDMVDNDQERMNSIIVELNHRLEEEQ